MNPITSTIIFGAPVVGDVAGGGGGGPGPGANDVVSNGEAVLSNTEQVTST